ncbi:MAG TPA: sigma 54-interacting transcriptional regulator, partial [Kofleriaceae bacterium]|nr:sigma 54-interacting transcriptional regulator [Kofleriaceae bacterium]
EDLRTTLQTALDIEKAVRGVTAGFHTPTFVVDAPGGGGKRVAHSFEHYDRDTGISVFSAPSVKPGFFLYFDPIDTLAPEVQERWKRPDEQDRMIAATVDAAGAAQAASARASSVRCRARAGSRRSAPVYRGGMADGRDERSTLIAGSPDHLLRLPSLVVTVKPPQGPVVEAELAMRPLVVGTSPEGDLVVDDPQVSRRHCELQLTGEGIVLRDLGSKNGTRIDRVLIREVVLPLSVPVILGSSELVVHAKGEPTVVPMSPASSFGEAVGESFPMRTLFAKLERAAVSDHTILLLGESGTGKEVLARAIHDHSPRKNGPFVVFDCGSVSPNLVEAELFGNVKGAFTGADKPRAGLLEEANGGTLFLDEIGELPLDLQPKLLRALEARQIRRIGANEWRTFDARILAATHRNLRAQATEGSFREDLYYRLAVVEMHVPALRERKEDIPLLVNRFLAAHTPPGALSDLPPHALKLLAAHDWPGNVRELRNMVARLVLFPERINELIGPIRRTSPPVTSSGEPAPEAGSLGDARHLGPLLSLPLLEARELWMEPFDRSYLTAKLNEHKGNISHAADAMGISRQAVHRLLGRYGLKAK